MTSEEFWKDDPQLFASYRTSFVNRKKREMEELDYICWLQGLYINDGNNKLTDKLLLGMARFMGSKVNKPLDKYPKEPYSVLSKKTQKGKKEDLKAIKYEKYQQDFAYFGTLKQRYLDNLRNKQKKGE